MNQQLQQRADTAIAAYRDEVEEWPVVPIWTVRSRERLTSLIALGAPEFIIKGEIDLLYQRINRMKAARLGEPIH